MKKLTRYKKEKIRRYLERLVKRHGKVKVCFMDLDEGRPRERIIRSSGTVSVRYWVNDGRRERWSRYDSSCFVHWEKDKVTLKESLRRMMHHDSMNYHIVPMEVWVGPKYKKLVKDYSSGD